MIWAKKVRHPAYFVDIPGTRLDNESMRYGGRINILTWGGASVLLSLAACDRPDAQPPAESATRIAERATPTPGHYRMQALAADAPELSLDQFRGKLVLVNFFAASVEECRSDLVALNALQSRLQGRPFTVVGIAMDLKPQIYIASDLRYTMPVFPCAIGGKPARQVFPEIRALPTKWLLDRDGRVLRRYEAAAGLDQISADIEELLK